ncbi:serine phosphatase RsbU (regulator of sigma subunit) [Streptomyces sp. BK022]|uniref:ATP-binding SpoIIE family protein phosphatase n=1 Tax=Streptomyces sp. BK022 TaxID=2512123 RepID=UPI001029FE76|nr:SpoIIE family protein phosphatase [Streptomyces sp. BK022]RZU46030.1 serine phosphatase RsbU (regulator of sigma subunit) [Streptomyces sp. BK022]
MSAEVDKLLHRLVQGLRPQVGERADALLRRLRDELPGLWEHEDLAVLALQEITGHLTTFLDLLDDQVTLAEVAPPELALWLSRECARRGLPLSGLLRAYRIGHMILLRQMQAEAARLTDDPELISTIATRMTDSGFAYVDISSELVVTAYTEERERRLRRRLALTDGAGRRIGTTLDITRTAEELVEVATEGFADLVVVDLLDSAVSDIPSPHRSTDDSSLRRVALGTPGTVQGCPAGRPAHHYPEGSAQERALTSGQPVLRLGVEARGSAPWEPAAGDSVLLLPLQARGAVLGLVQFFRGGSTTPFDHDDLSLAQEIAARAAVSIDNARRYTHERLTALTLQRSLLPQRPVRNAVVETAGRYLPSGGRAGLGGDWYDVIQLSGARMALVVGDVAGGGLEAAAAMGRLRMAVRAFADIDLMPDELLTHLDDVVIRLRREEGRDEGDLSATCLYAVYDASTRTCSLASAGHVPPAVVTPSEQDAAGSVTRSVDFLDVPLGPPLGVGGLPFETAQFDIPEGSLLVFHTDGLTGSGASGVEASRAVLREQLAAAPESLEAVCDRLLDALLPDQPADDTTLLVARTRALDARHIAVLDVPSDPAAVSRARRFAAGRLTEWGLEDLSFATELIVSELVTNAVRYGRSPIQLRMILQSSLTCEVFDASSTAPHLRRARTFDEGGRGLLLVAQMADRWGTRHSREGKVIWAEQPLPEESGRSGEGALAVPGVDLTITVPPALDDTFPSA